MIGIFVIFSLVILVIVIGSKKKSAGLFRILSSVVISVLMGFIITSFQCETASSDSFCAPVGIILYPLIIFFPLIIIFSILDRLALRFKFTIIPDKYGKRINTVSGLILLLLLLLILVTFVFLSRIIK